MYSKEMILEEIRRVAKNLGVGALKQKDFEEHSTIPLSTVKYYLGTWKGAIKDAGLSVSGSLDVVKREDLLKELMRLYNETGETPTPATIKEKGKFEIKLYEDKWKSLSEAFAEARKMKNLKTDSFATQEVPEVIPLAEEPIAENIEPADDVIPVVLGKEDELGTAAEESAPQELSEAYMVEEESSAAVAPREEPPVADEPAEKPPAVEETPEEPAIKEVKEELPSLVDEEVKEGDDLEVTQESIRVTDEEVKKAQDAAAEEEKQKAGAKEAEEEESEAADQSKGRDGGRKERADKVTKDSSTEEKAKEKGDEDIDLDDISFDEDEEVDVEFSDQEEADDQDEGENILDEMEDDEHRTEEIDKKDTAIKKRSSDESLKSDQREDENMSQKPKIRYIPQTVKPKKLAKKKTVLGEPISFRGLRHAPVSREGVIFVFGMVCQELGFVVEALRPDIPDCEGTRYVDEGGQEFERVRMCFCYKSSDFKGEDESLCDLIICWNHDWDDPPLEILELSDVIKYLGD